MLNKSEQSGHACLTTPDFKGNYFSFSLYSIMFSVGLSHIAYFMLMFLPPIPRFFRVLVKKTCWILSQAFLASIEMIIWFLSLILFMWSIVFIDSYVLKQPYILQPTWLWCIIFFLFLIVFTFTFMWQHCLCNIPPSNSRQNMFCHLVF
jgi:hypothetical protein